jgi:hypothetical protein
MCELSCQGRVRFLLGLFEGRVRRLSELNKICAPGDLKQKEMDLVNSAWNQIIEVERKMWLGWRNTSDFYFDDPPARMSGLPPFRERDRVRE